MPDPEATDLRSIRPGGPALNATALRSTKAGLAALCLVSFALPTFAPGFNLLLGYGLMIVSMGVAVVGARSADRSAHEARRNDAATNGTNAKSGAPHSPEAFVRVVTIKEFYEPSDQPKQGQIALPLEKGHELITDLRLKIGNVTYGSSTQNRTDALNAFLEAIAKGQDAALVQYDPPRDVYWIAVTIPPKEARTTITTLEMPLTKTDGFYEYTYRLSIDARDSVSYLRVHAHVETAAPLGEVQVPSHPNLPVVRGGLHFADAYINETRPAATGDLHIRFRAAGASLGQFAEPNGDRYVRFSLDAADPTFV